MPVTRTCGNCSKRYTITNVPEIVVGGTIELEVTCPHCGSPEGTITAPDNISSLTIQKAK